MRKAINAHCHIYPAKIAARAVEGIKNFYDLDMMTLNGMTDDLVRDGSQVGCVHYLVHSVATVPKQVNSINEFIALKNFSINILCLHYQLDNGLWLNTNICFHLHNPLECGYNR